MKNDQVRALVNRLLDDLLAQNALAEAADAKVAREKVRIRRYCARKDYAESSMRDKMRNDYDLQDALDVYRYRCSEVARLSQTLCGVVGAVAFLRE